MITLLGGLVDRSLLQRDGDNTEPGYRMLHTIRTFARQHPSAQSSSTAHRRHMEHFAALCDKGGVGLETSEQPRWLTTLSAYASDIDSAMRFAAANGEAHALWQMCGSLTFVWVAAGRFAEATRWFASCCEVLDVPIATAAAGSVGSSAPGRLLRRNRTRSGTRGRGQNLGRGDRRHDLRRSRKTRSASVACSPSALERGEALQASIEASKQVDDWCYVDSSQVLAYIDLQEFRVDEALRGLESVRPLVERLRHPPLLAWDWLGRYQAAAIRGHVGEARTIESEAIWHVAAAGDVSISALMVATQAQIAQREGRARNTLEDVERSLDQCGAQGAESAALALMGVLIDACLTLDYFNRARELLDGAETDIDRTAPDAPSDCTFSGAGWHSLSATCPRRRRHWSPRQRVAERHGTAPGLAVVHCWKAFVAVRAEQPTIAWRSALAAWSVLRAERLDGHAIGSLRVDGDLLRRRR